MANASFGTLVDPEEQELDRRRKLAEALRAQSSSPIDQQTAGGMVVPISPVQGLAKLLQSYKAGQIEKDADAKQQALIDRRRAQGAADIQGVIAALRGTPAQPEVQGNNPSAYTPAQEAQAPDMNRALAIALKSDNPMVQGLGGSLISSMMPKAPKMERVEIPDGQGGKRVGFVDMNSPNPMSTFQAGGADPAKGIAVNGKIVSPYSMGTEVPKQLSPDSVVAMGPGGALVPNAPVIQAKSQIAAAGKPVTNVSVNTANKPMLTEIGKGVGEQVINDFGGARSAVQVLNNVEQMKQGLGNAILGPGAGARVKLSQIGQVLGVNGKDTTEQLQNTRNLMQGLARQELAAAGGMKGQGQITEAERGILRRAESGQIDELTKPEVETLLNALSKTANYRINLHQQNLQRLKKDPNAAGVVDYMNVQPPTTQRSVVRTGTLNGRKVVQYSDGTTDYAD